MRRQEPADGGQLGLRSSGGSLRATHRPVSNAGVGTMVVLRAPGEVYLLCHTGGHNAVSWVEQIDPVSLRTIRRSPSLEGGPTWPGGLACHANGSLYVVFGRHAHRSTPQKIARPAFSLKIAAFCMPGRLAFAALGITIGRRRGVL